MTQSDKHSSHISHILMGFTSFLAFFVRRLSVTMFPIRGCALYTKLKSIHHFNGLNKGRVLYTGASYTRKITVYDLSEVKTVDFAIK